MSIETERWFLNSNDQKMVVMRVKDETLGEEYTMRIADGMTPARARAVVVLPEALALLKEMLGAGGDSDSTTLQPDHEERTRDILRRAGVLK